MRPLNRGPATPRITALAKTRKTRPAAFNYHVLGADLLGAIGEYCSYCEAPLSSNAAVEHIVSKSTDETLRNRWENFLLACVNCNSTKGTKIQGLDELSDHIWPCTPVDATFEGKTYYSPVGAFAYGLDASGDAIVTAVSGPKQAAAQKTLALVGLDKPADADPAVRDRRIINRTETWRLATQAAIAYSGYLRDDGTVTGGFGELLQAQIIETARASGFWSVWMTVFTAMMNSRPSFVANKKSTVLSNLFCKTFPGTYWGDNLKPLDPNYTGLPLS